MPTTIEQFILSQQEPHPDASGSLTRLLCDMACATKMIAFHVRKAGLGHALGHAGSSNVHGEAQMRLDVLADQIIRDFLSSSGQLAILGSEEHENPVEVSPPHGKYVLLYDPLDGSSNIDVNVSIGTIFSIFRRKSADGHGQVSDCLQPGRDLVAAGYVIYGPSTMMVYSTGSGVHGFTLDPEAEEFFLSHPNIRVPARLKYYSANHVYEGGWDSKVRKNVKAMQEIEGITLRWVGSLVADFHRNLLAGGVFCYPGDQKSPEGKLRLLYEAAPLAFLAEQAGGIATNGQERILEITPSKLHQRTPLFIVGANNGWWWLSYC